MRFTYLNAGALAVLVGCSGRAFQEEQGDGGSGGSVAGSGGTKSGGSGGGGTGGVSGGGSGGSSGGGSGGTGGTGGAVTTCTAVGDCSSSEFCKFPAACGGIGACKPRPSSCDTLLSPVCGCDGVAYASPCVANSKGVDAAPAWFCGLCPLDTPSGSCSDFEGVQCTYGAGARPECRTQASCHNDMWETSGEVCATAPECIDGVLPMQGAICTVAGSGCELNGTSCVCSSCGLGGACTSTPTWQCTSPPPAPCPITAPNRGSMCSSGQATECLYGSCAGGMPISARCVGGVWTWEYIGCPV
jgi:hypothetical protein